MRKSTNTLTPAQVSRSAVDFRQPYLQFRAVGKVTGERSSCPSCSPLPHACPRSTETCGRLAKAPCEETFTAALSPQLLDLDALKRRVNAAFGFDSCRPGF